MLGDVKRNNKRSQSLLETMMWPLTVVYNVDSDPTMSRHAQIQIIVISVIH